MRKFAFHRSRAWYRFSRNPLSVVGLLIVVTIVLMAVLAPFVTPYPEAAGKYLNIPSRNQAPSLEYWFGTDRLGRDVFSRVVFGYRISLMLGIVVLSIAAPLGIVLGLISGYLSGRIEFVIMRITDIFLAVPSLVLAMAVLGLFEPSLDHGDGGCVDRMVAMVYEAHLQPYTVDTYRRLRRGCRGCGCVSRTYYRRRDLAKLSWDHLDQDDARHGVCNSAGQWAQFSWSRSTTTDA